MKSGLASTRLILEHKRPRFMTTYFSGLDEIQHETMPAAPNRVQRSKSSTVSSEKFELQPNPSAEDVRSSVSFQITASPARKKSFI